MSLINTISRGLIHKDGEHSITKHGGSWRKGENGKYWVSNRLTNLLHVYIPLFPVWIFSLFTNWGKKLIGRALGYSSCAHCGMAWLYVKGKTIYYCESSGMFPLCVDCFDKLAPEEIDPHIEAVVWNWLEIEERHGLTWDKEQSPAEIIAAAKQQVRVMKAS